MAATILATSIWMCGSAFVLGQSGTLPTARTTLDRVYSSEQAREGRTLFYDVCIACHADPFWKARWRGKPMSELYTTIRKDMPDDNPGTLTGPEVVAALAYMLESNGMPAGTDPLPDDERLLADITLVEPTSAP